jgi:serine/threonine-protein kinase
MPLALDEFVGRIVASHVLSAAEVETFVETLPEPQRPTDSQELARLLVRAKKLTAYQAQEIYKGQGKKLVLGNYVILDKLGQGAWGWSSRPSTGGWTGSSR